MNLEIGAIYEKDIEITEKAVRDFATLSNDMNPLHLDDEYASKSIFKKRVVHGMLIISYLSGILGMDFPGKGTIYLSQNIKFIRPVYVGETIKFLLTVIAAEPHNKYRIRTKVYNEREELVIDGEAQVKV